LRCIIVVIFYFSFIVKHKHLYIHHLFLMLLPSCIPLTICQTPKSNMIMKAYRDTIWALNVQYFVINKSLWLTSTKRTRKKIINNNSLNWTECVSVCFFGITHFYFSVQLTPFQQRKLLLLA